MKYESNLFEALFSIHSAKSLRSGLKKALLI